MKQTLRIGVSAALVAVLLWGTDPAAALARLRHVQLSWLILAFAMLTAQTLLMTMRWRLTAGRLDLRIGRRQALGEYYLGQIVNMTLPGGVLGDAGRAVRTRSGAGLMRAAQAVMIERLAGQIALAVMTVVGFAAALAAPGGLPWPAWTGLALLGVVLAIGAVGALGWVVAKPFAAAVRTSVFAREVWPRQVALGLVIASLNLAAFAACARATGTVLPPEALVTLVPLVLTAMLIPISIAGWGWREGAAAGLFPLVGADPAAGIAAGIAFGLVILATSLPGLLWPILAPNAPRALTQGHGGASAVQWVNERDPKDTTCRTPPSS